MRGGCDSELKLSFFKEVIEKTGSSLVISSFKALIQSSKGQYYDSIEGSYVDYKDGIKFDSSTNVNSDNQESGLLVKNEEELEFLKKATAYFANQKK